MKFEIVSNPDIIHKAYRRTAVQANLDRFMDMDCSAVRCVLSPNEYKSAGSARMTYSKAAKRLGYPVVARVINGELYLIKTASIEEQKC